MKKKCVICNTSFETKYPFQKVCSKECQKEKNKLSKRKWDIDNIEWKRKYENIKLKHDISLREYRQQYLKEFKRPYILKNKYGITLNQWNELRQKQNYECAICGIHENDNKKSLAIDHNHETGEIRGLLCTTCNTGIGLLKDDIKLVEKALKYLLKSKTGWFIPKIGEDIIE